MAADVSKHLDRAKRFLEKNRVEDAIEAYLAVLDDAPQHQEATQALGDLYARLDKPDRAAVYYGLLFDLLVDPREESKALAIYNRFLRSSTVPQPPERIARYAFLQQRQNRPDEAIEQYNKAGELFTAAGRGEDALFCWERQLASVGGAEADALLLFGRAYRLAPHERSVALLYADAKLRAGEASKALELLEPFAGSESDAAFLSTYGDALMHAGQLNQALSIFEQLLREKNEGIARLFDLADHYAAAGQDAKAVELLQTLKQRMFASKHQNEFAAHLDAVAGKHLQSQALLEFWAAIYNELNRESQYFETLLKLFDVYVGKGNFPKACETLEKLMDIDAYDYRNQERLERLRGHVDEAFLKRLTGRLAKSGGSTSPGRQTSTGQSATHYGRRSADPSARGPHRPDRNIPAVFAAEQSA